MDQPSAPHRSPPPNPTPHCPYLRRAAEAVALHLSLRHGSGAVSGPFQTPQSLAVLPGPQVDVAQVVVSPEQVVVQPFPLGHVNAAPEEQPAPVGVVEAVVHQAQVQVETRPHGRHLPAWGTA